MTVIQPVSYFDTKDDVFPVLSMCFKQSFSKNSITQSGVKFNGLNYEKYLKGEYFDDSMSKIDYESVSTNLSSFLISYAVKYNNGSEVWDTTSDISWKKPYHTASWNSWGSDIVKCFGLEITDKNVFHLGIRIKRDIFPGRIRQHDRGFAVLLHYPNQILVSISTVMRQWTKRDRRTNYWMDFNVKGMKVSLNRFKPRSDNCIQEWENYDNISFEDHIKSVGCRTPYQSKSFGRPLCNTTEEMKRAQTVLDTKRIHPCRVITHIDYQMADADQGNATIYAQEKKWKYWFGVVIRFLNYRFKKIITKKEVDFQSLVGYIGGYIGMFMGFALAQIPEVIRTSYKCAKMLCPRICGKTVTNVVSVKVIPRYVSRIPRYVYQDTKKSSTALKINAAITK